MKSSKPLQTLAGDSPNFIGNVDRIIQDRIERWKPNDLYITRINNWFDTKWVKFSGTIMHEISVWKGEVTVPPFHPNRVEGTNFYQRVGENYREQEMKVPLHIVQESTQNLKRRITDFSGNGLFVWYSGNSLKNDKGSLMGYLISEAECFTFYLTLNGDKEWNVGRAIGLTKEEIRGALEMETKKV